MPTEYLTYLKIGVYTIIALALVVVVLTVPRALMSLRLARNRDKFKCSMCGNCCRLRIITLTEEDVKKLESEGHRDFYLRVGNEIRMKRKNGKCVFLKDDRCSIFNSDARPKICRNFPFFKYLGIPYCRIMTYCPAIDELKSKLNEKSD